MTEWQADRVEALFGQAADLPPDEQRALLDAACASDPTLRADVERLLADDARLRTGGGAATFLNSPLLRLPSDEQTPEALGSAPLVPPAAFAVPERIGSYRVLRLLGEGGMGTVYEAEQDNPRRPVALKVIRPGFVTPAMLKRFAHEAQVLGRLHHPGIAPIYDAGVADDGRPFFALELVRGLPLDEYARRHGLDLAARLDLLARVCDAVQHAHEQGVIHRDLKPGNVMVDETGRPRVLDFGVARATGADLRGATDLTRTGQLVGTLNYMSPEQVAGGPAAVDARSDVYALGVILFELLADRLPYSLKGVPLPEAARLIREQGPARLGALDPRCRGDVETVVAKALEKDRGRRYPSAAALAADLRRHLRHEPILARPPSALYHLGKFARRHKALVAATAVFLSLLLGGGAVTAWQAVRLARAERDQAVQQSRRSQEVQDALARAAALREQARSPAGGTGKWAEARAVARRAEALAEGGPVAPGLADRVADLLRELGEEEKDRAMVAELDGIRLRLAEVKESQFDTSDARPRYSEALRRYGLDVEAVPAEEAARRVRESAIREALLTALDQWAWDEGTDAARAKLWAVANGADDNPWRRRLREAMLRKDSARLKELATDPRALEQPALGLALLGDALQGAGLPEEAAVFLRQAQQRHPDDFWINHNLGFVLWYKAKQPRAEEALGYFRAALALRPNSPGVHFNLGNALSALDDLPGAAACYRRSLELDPKFFSAVASLGVVLRKQGDLTGAAAYHRKALELRPKDARTYNHLGATLQAQGDLPAAAASFRVALGIEPENALTHYNLGTILLIQGDFAGAAARYRRSLRTDPKFAQAHCNLGQALLRLGELRAALASLRTGHDLGSAQKGWPNPSEQWVKHCEYLLELDGRLPAILKGEARPGERIALADLCRYKGLDGASVRFFREAFAADAKLADDLRAGHRYRAACSAALAGCGQGNDAARPDEAERARLRRQALEWLRIDLARWARRPPGGTQREAAQLRQELHRWQLDPALAGVREAAALATLPSAERAEWQRLWADVAATLAKAGATK
jgi:serine/threonine protein kinase/Tfp pilus assembly protein PilF